MKATSFAPELVALADSVQKGNSRVVQAWVRFAQSIPYAQQPFPEEGQLVDFLKMDFERPINRGLFYLGVPKEIETVRTRLARVLESETAREDHVLSVSLDQYSELCRVLEPELKLQVQLEKELRNVERGIQKRNDEINQLEAWLDQVEAFLKTNPLAFMGVFDWNSDAFKRLKIDPRNFSRVIDSKKTDLRRIIPELDSLETKEASLKKRLALIDLYRNKRDALKANLEQAGRLPTPVTKPSVDSPMIVHSAGSKHSQGLPYAIRSKSYSNGKGTTASAPEESKDVTDKTITCLKNAIELGNQEGVLQMILPSEGSARRSFERRWAPVFAALGFTGDLRFCEYQDVNARSGPIVVTWEMNTHKNLWDGDKERVFLLMESSPNLLLHRLRGVK